MKENIVVSERGQVTLPAAMRRRLGIKAGGIVVVEDRDGELVIRPAAVVELAAYRTRRSPNGTGRTGFRPMTEPGS